jgi:HAD superfamily hydrolase (TIGR01509 family)
VKNYFDFFISSAHTGLRKPDPRIYELALKEMNDLAKKKGMPTLAPNDIVFLDDIGINLKWAAKAGMRTLKVNLGRTKEAVMELEDITGLQLLQSEGKARL